MIEAVAEVMASTEGISVGKFEVEDKIVELEDFSWEVWVRLEVVALVPDLSKFFSSSTFKI